MRTATTQRASAFIWLAVVLGLGFTGCQSDDPAGPDEIVVQDPGQVTVNMNPDDLDAPWFLIRPDKAVVEGSGLETLDEMPTGQYKLVWGAVSGWYSPTPNPTQSVLSSGGEITFSADYTEIQIETGVIAVDAEPDQIDAPWTLTGPSGFMLEGRGDIVLEGREPGDYTVTFGSVQDYETAGPEQGTLAAGGRLDLGGSYIYQAPPTSGTILVVVTPDHVDGPWEVTGPGGTEQGTGDASLSDMPTGNYTVTFGSVDGWITPIPAVVSLTLDDGELEVASGNYIDNQGPRPDDPQINDIVGTVRDGGTASISGVDFGAHTLDVVSGVGPDGWIENNSAGTDLDAVTGVSGWDVGISTNLPPRISSERAYSGSNSLLGRVGSGDWQSVMRYSHDADFDKIYASFWININPIAYSNLTANMQWKWWRINDYGAVDNDCSEIYMMSRWSQDRVVQGQVALFCNEGCPWPEPCECYESVYDHATGAPLCNACNGRYLDYCTDESYESMYPTPDQWCRVEIYADSSDLDVPNGRLRVTIHKPGQAKNVVVDWEGVLTHNSDCCEPGVDPWRYFIFQNYWNDDGAGGSDQRADFFYDDIYLQFDTQARVEIGNAPVYAACTQLETQTPTSWSGDSSSIDIEWNYGGFSSGDPVYVFVTRADGSVSAGYRVDLD